MNTYLLIFNNYIDLEWLCQNVIIFLLGNLHKAVSNSLLLISNATVDILLHINLYTLRKVLCQLDSWSFVKLLGSGVYKSKIVLPPNHHPKRLYQYILTNAGLKKKVFALEDNDQYFEATSTSSYPAGRGINCCKLPKSSTQQYYKFYFERVIPQKIK